MSIRSNVDARALDQRITIQSPTRTRTASGTIQTSWSTVVTAWACVNAMKANERFAAAEKHQVNAYTCWVRADVVSRFQVTTGMRVMWRNIPYDIVDIPDNTDRGRLTALFLQGGLSDAGE